MRYAVFVVLALVPVCLVGWIARQGRNVPPNAFIASAAASSAPSGHGDRAVSGAQGAKGASPEDAALLALLSGSVEGATIKDKVTLYDEQSLFEAIDGAAPLYIERHFRRLAASEMATADGGELSCHVYDMTEAENAASIFFAEKSAASRPVEDWPQAIAAKGSFIFRSGPYYVKLTAFDRKAEAALPKLARALRERMR